MKTYPAYLIGIHPYSFRSGEPARIIGVKFATPPGYPMRACFHIRFKDGVEDYVPISDLDNYQITSGPIITKTSNEAGK